MPIAAPNRIADPVTLEAFEAPCKLKQAGGLFIPFKNTSTTEIYVGGEPIYMFGRVCIVQKTIMPGKIGTLISDFIVDARIKTDGAGNISQDALVYWDLDEDVLVELESGDATSGLGAASEAAPTNGFILGRAVLVNNDDTYAATATSVRVRVASLPGQPTTYGTYY